MVLSVKPLLAGSGGPPLLWERRCLSPVCHCDPKGPQGSTDRVLQPPLAAGLFSLHGQTVRMEFQRQITKIDMIFFDCEELYALAVPSPMSIRHALSSQRRAQGAPEADVSCQHPSARLGSLTSCFLCWKSQAFKLAAL